MLHWATYCSYNFHGKTFLVQKTIFVSCDFFCEYGNHWECLQWLIIMQILQCCVGWCHSKHIRHGFDGNGFSWAIEVHNYNTHNTPVLHLAVISLCGEIKINCYRLWAPFIDFNFPIGRDKMAAIFQTTFLYAFYWMKLYEFRLRFCWRVFLRVQLTILLNELKVSRRCSGFNNGYCIR